MLIRAIAICLACAAASGQDRPAGQDPLDGAKLGVRPLDEPAWPFPDSEAEIQKLGHTPIPGGGYQFEKRAPDGSVMSGAVVPGRILMNRDFVELLACSAGGKEHESVLRIDCDIQALDVALSLSNLDKGPVPEKLGRNLPQGTRVVALVQWKEGDKVVVRRAEDLVYNTSTQAPLPRLGWTYVALMKKMDAPGPPGRKLEYRLLSAESTRSLMMIRWNTPRDGATLFDNPHPAAMDGTIFHANHAVLPPPGTPIALIFRTPTAAEREEIAKLEKDVK